MADLTPRVERRGPGVLGTVLIAAIVAGVVGAFAGLAGYAVGRNVDRAATAAAEPAMRPVTPVSADQRGDISTIAEETLPSVVSLLVEGGSRAGSGSGFVIRPNGYILTNHHVANLAGDGGTLTAVFADGSRAPATIVGSNPSYDLAVVKVDRTGLPTVRLGDSDAVEVGDTVIAIGAPLGLDGTVTAGIVSALDRPVTAGDSADVSFINAIQTDAAINPGNSGGPLLNDSGEVVGVNSAIASLIRDPSGEAGNIGLGFAIPSNSARRIAEELIATGTSRTPVMGVKLDLEFAGTGARVDSVTPDSGAQEAGLRAGDVITAVDERAIDDATELVVEVRAHAPGDTIAITYERSGARSTADVVLGDDGS